MAALGPLLTPINWWPYSEYYVPKYVLLALSVGCGLRAVRSGWWGDRVCGLIALLVGGGTTAYIVWTLASLIRA
ncbi:hypothetical protein [Limnoglobus roseus]|uniref:hypothetical protein n=1 Tax=Limnoglobus roseus TaxID=2598579 RepID=UPI0011EB6533|nr:hypothetical protein [Limnoglobus roseus]